MSKNWRKKWMMLHRKKFNRQVFIVLVRTHYTLPLFEHCFSPYFHYLIFLLDLKWTTGLYPGCLFRFASNRLCSFSSALCSPICILLALQNFTEISLLSSFFAHVLFFTANQRFLVTHGNIHTSFIRKIRFL